MSTEELATGPVTVELTVPIQAHGETLTSLTLHRPKLGALKHVSIAIKPGGEDEATEVKINFGDAIPAIAAVARIPPSSAAQIDLVDAPQVWKAVRSFLPTSLRMLGS